MQVNLNHLGTYIMIIFNYFSEYNGTMYTCDVVQPEDRYVLIAGIIAAVVLNIVLGLISWWRCYANNYLHWGALATWCLLLVQGCVFYGLRAKVPFIYYVSTIWGFLDPPLPPM